MPQKILNPGNADCKHSYILYIDNKFDGQAWWCDQCTRQERMNYNPDIKILFPAEAYLRTLPEPQEEMQYDWQVNAQGRVEGRLPEPKVIHKSLLERLVK